MKLIYKNLEDVLEWSSKEIPVIVIENLEYKNMFIGDLILQSGLNKDAPFFISDGLPNGKNLIFETIFNPFELNVNDTVILNRVRKIYEGLIQDDLFELSELTKEVSDYLNNIALSLPVSVEWEGDLNVKRLIQLFELTVADDSENLFERITNYLQVTTQLGMSDLYIFVNLKQYLTKDRMLELYSFAEYEEINLLLLENQTNELLKIEKQIIIDNDLCVIY